MTWRERLIGLAFAGGLAGGLIGGCDDGPKIPLCNASPDPCCAYPDSQACFDSRHPEAGVDAPMRDAELPDASTD